MTLSFWNLFVNADIVGRFVICSLIVASVFCWKIMFSKIFLIKKLGYLSRAFEQSFQKHSGSLETLYYNLCRHPKDPFARLLRVSLQEISKMSPGLSKNTFLNETERYNLESLLVSAVQTELARIKKGISFLASTASAAPFVGLFGTVWGIMHGFEAISRSGNTSLVVVAPAISEALFATALGLFVAIPCSIGYNKIAVEIQNYQMRLKALIPELLTYFSRELTKLKK